MPLENITTKTINSLPSSINREILLQQQSLLKENQHTRKEKISPLTDFDRAGNIENIQRGKRLISQGQVGCLVVAGGQGTRLGIEGPKGLFPISVIEGKSLFQLIAEKTLAAGNLYGLELSIAIMTSPQNDAATKEHFVKHNYFELKPHQVTFFVQEQLPLLNEEGEMFLETADQVAMGPDGNGNVLKHFVNSGIWEAWNQNGIEYINFILIDNPLADPWDSDLIGFHDKEGAEVVIKCVSRQNPDESVGVLVKKGEQVRVTEYTELSENEKTAVTKEGALLHQCANISLFSFKMNFINKIAKIPLPLHLAHKAAKYLAEDGTTKKSSKPIAWKFETFIFDILPRADSVRVLLYPRNQCFAPLKNKEGADSPETVREALLEADREAWKKVTGSSPPKHSFELTMDFHYPTEELVTHWKNQP